MQIFTLFSETWHHIRIYTPYVDLSMEEINMESHEIYGMHCMHILHGYTLVKYSSGRK